MHSQIFIVSIIFCYENPPQNWKMFILSCFWQHYSFQNNWQCHISNFIATISGHNWQPSKIFKPLLKSKLFVNYSFVIKTHTWTITLCLGLSHETMVCTVCLSIFLWICDMAELLCGTFVSWWYSARIWPSVTDMQHYYHARYPTDDWHLAYMFSLVYFSVEGCLESVFSILLAQGEIPASGSMPPSRWVPPSRKKKQNRTEVTQLSTWTRRGAFELTHGSACIIEWQSGLRDSLISTYIAQFMGVS